MSRSDQPGPDESDGTPLDAAESASTEETTAGSVDAAPAPADPADTTATAKPAPTRSGNRGILILSAVGVVLLVAGVVVYLLTGDDSTDTASPDVPTIENSIAPSGVVPAQPSGGTTATITAPSSASRAAAGDAQKVAEQVAQAITASDLGTLGQLSCDPSSIGSDDTFPADAKVEVVGDPTVNGDNATVKVKVSIPNAPAAEVPMPLIKKDGRWCIPG